LVNALTHPQAAAPPSMAAITPEAGMMLRCGK
jgi:hypothetical protein